MAAPDEPLGLTVHTLPSPIGAAQRSRSRGRWQMAMVLAACAAPVIASYFMYYVVRPSGGATAYGTLIDPPRPMPGLTAKSLDGQPVPLRSLAGQWLIVTVSGSDCPEACEQRLFMQRQLREMVGRERDRIDKLWIVLDDGPLAEPLKAAVLQSPAMQVLRLPREAVAAWLKPAEGQPLEAHLYLVDPLGQWMMREPVAPDPSRVKRDLDRLLRASGGWDQPGRQALIEPPPAAGSAARP